MAGKDLQIRAMQNLRQYRVFLENQPGCGWGWFALTVSVEESVPPVSTGGNVNTGRSARLAG
jgi:hypothetical protein